MTDNNDERLRTGLGFAMKAGKVKSGELAAEKTLKSGKAFVAVVDSEASEQTKKHWSDMCNNAAVPVVFTACVGRAIGREAHMVACVTDRGFAQMILRGREEKQL